MKLTADETECGTFLDVIITIDGPYGNRVCIWGKLYNRGASIDAVAPFRPDTQVPFQTSLLYHRVSFFFSSIFWWNVRQSLLLIKCQEEN